jgi:hypothetical protein
MPAQLSFDLRDHPFHLLGIPAIFMVEQEKTRVRNLTEYELLTDLAFVWVLRVSLCRAATGTMVYRCADSPTPILEHHNRPKDNPAFVDAAGHFQVAWRHYLWAWIQQAEQ